MEANKEIFEKYWALKKEDDSWDYKRELNIEKKSGKYNLIKDFLAFTNYGGGFLLLGVDDRNHSLHNQTPIDKARIGDILYNNLGFNIEFDITYFEKVQNGDILKLGIIYIHPSENYIHCPHAFQDENRQIIIYQNDLLTRRNTQSIKADSDDLNKINLRIQTKIKKEQVAKFNNIKPPVYKSDKQKKDALWNSLQNKYEFTAENVSAKLRGILYYSSHSKKDFVNLIGMDLDSFEKIINGNDIPELSVLIRISRIFDIELDFFFQNDYFGRRPFWKEDLVRMSILQRISPQGDIKQLKNVDCIIGEVVYETAKNILGFYNFISSQKIDCTWDSKLIRCSEALKSTDVKSRKKLTGELAHQYYKILEQVQENDITENGMTKEEQIIANWYSCSSDYLARIFVESIEKIIVIEKDKIEIYFYFWEEVLSNEIRGRTYNNLELKMEFSSTRFKM